MPPQVAVPYFENLRVSVASLPPSVKHVKHPRTKAFDIAIWWKRYEICDTNRGAFAILFFFGDVSPRYERRPTQLAMPPVWIPNRMIQVLSAGYGEMHSAHWTHRSRRFLKPHFEHFQGIKRLTETQHRKSVTCYV